MSKLNPFHRDLAHKLAKAWLNGNQTDRLAKAVERALRQPNNGAIFGAAIDRVADHDENVREFYWAILDHAANRIVEIGGKPYTATLFGLNLSGDREQICEFASEANLDKLSQIIAQSNLVAEESSCIVLPGLIPDMNLPSRASSEGVSPQAARRLSAVDAAERGEGTSFQPESLETIH